MLRPLRLFESLESGDQSACSKKLDKWSSSHEFFKENENHLSPVLNPQPDVSRYWISQAKEEERTSNWHRNNVAEARRHFEEKSLSWARRHSNAS